MPQADKSGNAANLREYQAILRPWVERIKEAERQECSQYGFVIPGDSSLAVVLGAMEEAAYAGDPAFDSRVKP